VKIGVDVGGTFTKAVACDATSEVLARSVVPTTHASSEGVAQGVVEAVGAVMEETRRLALGEPVLVGHSTTQAVNALLEGDTSVVGVLGIGRRPDLRRAKRRTEVGEVKLAPGRKLQTRHTFIDATAGLERQHIVRALRELQDAGSEVVCVSEAFGVDDARTEWLALEVAADLGIPACAGHELSGLYGLEMRTVTGALNASILPTALRTARLVEEAVARDAPGVPLLVMRGDGGAADLRAMKRHPLVTAFSGPAASVAGALRHLAVHDGVVVEVGGTSTNVSTVKGGRPVLSYVRVLEHVTCVRSLDVRVVGVAGGSLLRFNRRFGRRRLDDVGPRSAHIAGLPYCSFARPDDLVGGKPRLVSPRPGDPAEYLVLETATGRRFAVTLTCAAAAAGTTVAGSYAEGDAAAARTAFQIVGSWAGVDPATLATAALHKAASKIAAVVSEAAHEQRLERPELVGVGGGAGALIPVVGRVTGLDWRIPPDAEVISSVGDASSLVRVEMERTFAKPSADAVAAFHREVEDAAVAAGASPTSLQIESEALPERGALRVAASGSVALDIDATGADIVPDLETMALVAKREMGEVCKLVSHSAFYSVFTSASSSEAFLVVDRHGSVAARGRGSIVTGRGSEVAALLQERMPRLVKHFGPIAVAPPIRVLRGTQLVDLALFSQPDQALDAALAQCSLGHDEEVVVLLGDG